MAEESRLEVCIRSLMISFLMVAYLMVSIRVAWINFDAMETDQNTLSHQHPYSRCGKKHR